jgi:hypothetical protein
MAVRGGGARADRAPRRWACSIAIVGVALLVNPVLGVAATPVVIIAFARRTPALICTLIALTVVGVVLTVTIGAYQPYTRHVR